MTHTHSREPGQECRTTAGRNNRDAVPVCLKCLTPHSALKHYCENCGETVGQLTPYVPYLNIPYNYSIFGRMWKRAFVEQGVPIASRVLYVFMLLVLMLIYVPMPILVMTIMLTVLSFRIIEKLKRRPLPGHCQKCSYDLTGNLSGVCPECGTEIERTP